MPGTQSSPGPGLRGSSGSPLVREARNGPQASHQVCKAPRVRGSVAAGGVGKAHAGSQSDERDTVLLDMQVHECPAVTPSSRRVTGVQYPDPGRRNPGQAAGYVVGG